MMPMPECSRPDPPRGATLRARAGVHRSRPARDTDAAVRFVVRASAGPQTLMRLLNYFAQLGLAPRRVRADDEGGMMTVLIDQDGLGDHPAGIVADKMRSSVLVESVRLSRGGRLLPPLSGLGA